MVVGSGGEGGRSSPWIFIHGKNIVDRSLKVLFFCLFCYFSVFFFIAPLPWKRLNNAVFRYFLLTFGIFSVGPFSLENFLPTSLGIWKRGISVQHIKVIRVARAHF